MPREKTVYIKLEDYNPENFTILEEFPNKQFKKCSGGDNNEFTLHIIYPEDIVEIKEMDNKEIEWFLGKQHSGKEIVMLSCNWFPSNLVIGTKKPANSKYAYFSADSDLSRETGYIEGSGNLGTRSNCFLKEKLKNTLQILKDNGFDKFVIKK